MGAESFFIHVLPSGVEASSGPGGITFHGGSGLSRADILQHLGAAILPNGRYAFSEVLLLSFREGAPTGSSSTQVLSIVLEGCFACYAEALEAILEVATRIPGTKPATLFHPAGMNLPSTAREEFSATTGRIYAAKLSAFRSTFGDVHFVTLPDSQFYKEIKRRASSA